MKKTLVMLVAFWAALLLAKDESSEILIVDHHSLNGPDPGLDNIFAGRDGSGSLDTRSLFGRQLTCPATNPVVCGIGCCPAGDKCCPTDCCPLGGGGHCCGDSLGGCCAPTDNCVPAEFHCCPKTAETCGGGFCWDAGAVCCNGGSTACQAGYSCCGRNCCRPGRKCCNNGVSCCTDEETCCPGGCCPAGYTCSTDPGKCQRIQATQQTKTQAQISKSQSTKSSTTRSSSTTERSKPTTTKMSTTKSKSSTTTTGCRSANGISQPTSASLPAMEFVYVGNGIADDIPTNICLGIRHKLGSSAQEIVLTRALDGEKCSKARGRDSGCPGCCSGVRKPASSPNAGSATQCDEFPFKSTIEGGVGAWIRCVTAWQNTLQGTYINSWYADHGVGAGDQFIVRVVNLDCATVVSTDLQSCDGAIVRPRDAEPEKLGSGIETTTHRTLDNRTDVVVAPLGDLDSGGFQATARVLNGGLKNLVLIDSDGEEITPLDSIDAVYTPDGLAVSWDLDDYVGGIGLLGETETTNINFTWELVNSTSSQTESQDNGGTKPLSSMALTVSLATIVLALHLLQLL